MTGKKIVMLFTICVPLLIAELQYPRPLKAQGMPPARVELAEISTGMIAPESEFIGTVYYQEVSDVAAAVDGLVEEVRFDEGERTKKGRSLVILDSDLLQKNLKATQANYEQVLSDLEKVRRDLTRAENLFKNELISEQTYDERRFAVSGLEKRAISLKSDVERFEVELQKKTVSSPFEGIIIKRHVDRGEWLSAGSSVATIGNDAFIDVVAEVPESVIKFVRKGVKAKVSVSGQNITGEIIALIPRGDISTRTFPVKVRVKNTSSLIEGMQARVSLPTGTEVKALVMPRDAVINVFGNDVVYAVQESKAVMIQVDIIGYDGLMAGVKANGLSAGMKVVVKGNERLRDGQDVEMVSNE